MTWRSDTYTRYTNAAWGRAVSIKVAAGFALAITAPVLAVIADRARVTRNTIRLGRGAR